MPRHVEAASIAGRSNLRSVFHQKAALALAVVLLALFLPRARAQELTEPGSASRELKKLSLEELMNTEVTSLSKKPEKRFETPAAIYVITDEDIRRSGVTSIPEALRLAPGMQVARIDSNKWAIGVRGFASRLSRSVLALMDGRSVYTPLFAGVYWEVQDTMLEDIDRIEVIRGPGGTLWGANAVNGVINIITKSAKDTQGALVTGGGGSEEQGFGGVRYGGKIGESTHYRVYGKYFNRDAGFSRDTPNFDGWDMGRVGFRSDSDLKGGDTLTMQGDLYDGESGQRTVLSTFSPPFREIVQKDTDLSGGNLIGRWKHPTGENSELAVQAYYDETFRREPNFREERNTADLDLQHRFPMFWRQEVVWGLGYRLLADDTHAIPTLGFVPASREQQLFSAFVQDEIALVPKRLRLTIGSKFEHNDFTGFELQPSGRLLWIIAPKQIGWASITRAVRTSSRIEEDLGAEGVLDPRTPTFIRLIGDGNFDPEKVVAYELGYRIEPAERLFVDLAAFYNRYTDLLSIEPGAPSRETSPPPERVVIPFFLRNGLDGDVYGAELSADAGLLDWWRMGLSYAYLEIALQREGDSRDPSTVETTEGSSPHHQVSVQSRMDLPNRVELDGWFRYVDSLPAQNVRRYVTLDLRLGWHATPSLEIAAVGQNLVQNHHAEFGGSTARVEVERSVYGKITWRW